MIFAQMKKNSDLLDAYSVKGCQAIYNYCIYMPLIGSSLNLRLDFGSICPKIMIFAKNNEKAGAYYVHSLLKASNLFGLTAYMPFIMKWGIAKF